MHKSAIWDRTSPCLHIKCSLYVCSRVQGSQIFKQNSIISIHSKVIAYLLFWAPWPLGRGQGGWGVSRDMGGVPIHMHTCMHACICTCKEIANGHNMFIMLSPCCPCHPHMVPVVPTLSPHCLEGPRIIPNPPDSHYTHPSPPRGKGPRISKNSIRYFNSV